MRNETLFDVAASFDQQLKQRRQAEGVLKRPVLKRGLGIGLGVAAVVGAGIFFVKKGR